MCFPGTGSLAGPPFSSLGIILLIAALRTAIECLLYAGPLLNAFDVFIPPFLTMAYKVDSIITAHCTDVEKGSER